MVFNLKNFIKISLIDGAKKGIFAKEYANILAVNYLIKGLLTEEDLSEIGETLSLQSENIEEIAGG